MENKTNTSEAETIEPTVDTVIADIADANIEEQPVEFDSNKVVELNIMDVVNMFKTTKEGYSVLGELLHARVETLVEISPYILPEKLNKMSAKANGLAVNVVANLDRIDALEPRITKLEEDYNNYVDVVADESKTEQEKDLAMAHSVDEFNSITKELETVFLELESLTETYTIFVQNEIDLELRKTVEAKEFLIKNKENIESEFTGE